jgi:hypothetical protein
MLSLLYLLYETSEKCAYASVGVQRSLQSFYSIVIANCDIHPRQKQLTKILNPSQKEFYMSLQIITVLLQYFYKTEYEDYYTRIRCLVVWFMFTNSLEELGASTVV